MTTGMDLERRLEGYLADAAPAHAPDRLLEDALRVVGGTSQRTVRPFLPLERAGVDWRSLSVGRRTFVVAAALVALLGVMAAGTLLLRETAPPIPSLVLVTPTDPEDPALGVTVTIDDGRSTRELASFDAAALGGQWNGFSAAVGPTGLLALGVGGTPDDALAIVDLRGDEAPRRLEAPGYSGSWAPDGVRIATVDDIGTLVFDLETGGIARVSGDFSYVTVDSEIAWAADGSGFLSDPGIETLGVVRLDGTFVPGRVPRHQSGIGPRRVRDDGALLRCSVTTDDLCMDGDRTLTSVGGPTADVWVDDDPSIAIVDFAWTVGGGLWVLTETVAPGPRTVTILRVETDGSEAVTASVAAGADDPDPSSYCPGATFAAMAPDDSRLVIATSGDGCVQGPSWIVDTATGSVTAVEGRPAGWLDPDALTRPRRSIAPAVEVPPALLGDWGRGFGGRDPVPGGPERIHVGPGRMSVVVAGTPVEFAITPEGGDAVAVTLMEDALGCPAGDRGRYRWRVANDALSLSALEGSCEPMTALLEGTFEQSLGLSGSHEVTASEGRTYLWPEFGIRVTIPGGPATSVWSRDTASLVLAAGEGHWVLESAPSPSGDLDWAIRKIGQGARVEDLRDTTVAGRPAITGTIDLLEGSETRRVSIWGIDDIGGFTLRDGARFVVFTGPHGDIYSVVSWDDGDAALRAWADTLTASIDLTAD